MYQAYLRKPEKRCEVITLQHVGGNPPVGEQSYLARISALAGRMRIRMGTGIR